MRLLPMLLLLLLAGSTLAAEPNCGVDNAAYPATFTTASLLNGEFWAAASEDVREFYLRAATESLAAGRALLPSAGSVGWTYPQTAAWITAFYASGSDTRRLPLAIVLSYANRTRSGEDPQLIERDAQTQLKQLRASEDRLSQQEAVRTFCPNCGNEVSPWFDAGEAIYDVGKDDAAFQRWLDAPCSGCGMSMRGAAAPKVEGEE